VVVGAPQGVGHGGRWLGLDDVRGWHGSSGKSRSCGTYERHGAPAGLLGRLRGLLEPPVVLAIVAASFGQGGGPVVIGAGAQEHHEAPVGWSWHGHGYVRGCMCT
jgi:hypothetical protein